MSTTETNLAADQAARAEAIERARAALLPRTVGRERANAADLITVAEWIIRGYDNLSVHLDTDPVEVDATRGQESAA